MGLSGLPRQSGQMDSREHFWRQISPEQREIRQIPFFGIAHTRSPDDWGTLSTKWAFQTSFSRFLTNVDVRKFVKVCPHYFSNYWRPEHALFLRSLNAWIFGQWLLAGRVFQAQSRNGLAEVCSHAHERPFRAVLALIFAETNVEGAYTAALTGPPRPVSPFSWGSAPLHTLATRTCTSLRMASV